MIIVKTANNEGHLPSISSMLYASIFHTNVVTAAFLPKCNLKKPPKRRSYEKFPNLTLMKLTPACNFKKAKNIIIERLLLKISSTLKHIFYPCSADLKPQAPSKPYSLLILYKRVEGERQQSGSVVQKVLLFVFNMWY